MKVSKGAHPLKGIETVLLDMGNTLLDFHQGPSDEEKAALGLKHLEQYLKNLGGISCSSDVLHQSFYLPWIGDFGKREAQGIELDVQYYLNTALAAKNCSLDEKQCIQASKAFYREYEKHVRVNPYAQELLSYLKERGFQVGVVSNCCLYSRVYRDIFQDLGLGAYIDFYVFSYDYRVRKPNPLLFQKALEFSGTPPERTLMVGDSIKADIQGAKTQGMQTLWYNPLDKENTTDIVPDYQIRSFLALMEDLT